MKEASRLGIGGLRGKTQIPWKGLKPDYFLAFIGSYLVPTRFVGKRDGFEHHRSEPNAVLIPHGLEYGKDGQFRHTTQARTLDEAEVRAQGVRNKLASRNTHHDVYKYRQPELMQENYFHAVLEACNSMIKFLLICPTSALEKNFDPRNTESMPAFKLFRPVRKRLSMHKK